MWCHLYDKEKSLTGNVDRVLQSFYKVVLFVAVSTLCVPLYKAFPHLFDIFDIRDSITYIVYRVIRFSLYSASVAYKQRYPY